MAFDKAKLEEYHKRNLALITVLMIVWFAVSLGAIIIAKSLNEIRFMGFPLGYYMASQGSILVFIAEIFFYSWRMDKLDIEFGFAEERR